MSDTIFQTVVVAVFTILFVSCVYPFYYIFIASISSPDALKKAMVTWRPLSPTIGNYLQVFRLPGLFRSFLVSVARTIVGTCVTMFFTSILSYTLTKKELPARKVFYTIAIISMYVNAGLIPWYLTMRTLGLRDTFLVYILPGAVSAYSMILVKTYIESLSQGLEESAMIDGAGYFQVYWRIIMPISKPVLAAIVVFTAVNQWNQWTDNLLLVNNTNLKTLQMTLLEYLNQASNVANMVKTGGINAVSGVAISPFTLRMTITMVVTIPILLVYPFMQKYFISGIMIGAIKG
ncbi:sugar ABC transporter permease [Clostridia bacterium]|nr:sugar ABC transporter permease [Clostridia bacterium]